MWNDEENSFARTLRKNDEYWKQENIKREDIERSKNKNISSNAGSGSGLLIRFFIIPLAISFLIMKVSEFMDNNRISVLIIAGILLACVIICFIVRKKVISYGLIMFLTIIISLGLIICVISLGIAQNDGNFERWRENTVSSQSTKDI